MPHFIRAFIPGGTFFFTVALLERRRSLLTDHIDKLRSAVVEVRKKRPFTIDAIVVLPEHLHSIWTLPEGDGDFSSRWHGIKWRFSRGIPTGERLSPRRVRKGERGIWQRRFWEHAIRDETDFSRHVDYIHYNPVKHGHVKNTADWPYSSFHRFVKEGVYPADWAAPLDVRSAELE